MPDSYMTIVGNLVEDPTLRKTKNGHLVANLRVASTPRRFDRENEEWIDGQALFVSVSCWRALAENVVESFKKGQPVLVYGRYCCRRYEVNEQIKYAYELEALAVGHDLSRGCSTFAKTVRGPASMTTVPAGPDGSPADESNLWFAEGIPAADADSPAVDLQDDEAGVPEFAPA